ncbi:anthrone oxygenase family protein [Agromyces laixinhei]|uniref:anthrone oxygenase family protein n=1 Tax=Agromyces laixinhei TaxID=2585717 RepID=UPI0011161346|nr:anthrone oxygenase family protein [Agromyces laixinhei]
MTGGANVPRNNRLAAPAEKDAAALAAAWQEFRPGWLACNHVRTTTSTAACLAFVLALAG